MAMPFNMVANSPFMPAKLSIFREIQHENETFFPKSFGGFGILSYLCPRLQDDSSFYPVRASVIAQPPARAFLLAMSQCE